MTMFRSTFVLSCLVASLFVGCDSKSQQDYSAETLRFYHAERALVLHLRDKAGKGPVKYLVVKSLPDDYANKLEYYLAELGKSISSGVITVSSFWGTWSNTEKKNDHLYMAFRRPLAPGEVDTSWGTELAYRSASIVGESELPSALAPNKGREVSFSSCAVKYTDERVKSSSEYRMGP